MNFLKKIPSLGHLDLSKQKISQWLIAALHNDHMRKAKAKCYKINKYKNTKIKLDLIQENRSDAFPSLI